jgi:Asp-tRNA(Asn)/Glu-tRNA(Gln) amidotransferase A subunit family amidase
MRAGRLSCHVLVQSYLDRISRIDKHGPAINALVTVNPDALAVADSLDRRFARGGFVGELHCVPVIVKANMETTEFATTAGSLSLAGMRTGRDAHIVSLLKGAGAIVLAQSNMAEFAFSPYETVSSILPGYTKNPYALDRVPAGSSGGTAAAIAASLGLVGLGTDTGNSIRGPSSHTALVGIRSTMGLVSRAGIVPLFLTADVAGPMARTVADAARVLQVIAGQDSDDEATSASAGQRRVSYISSLDSASLRGARLGMLPQAYLRASADSEVLALFGRAVADLRRAGATVIDSVMISELDSLFRASRGSCNPFRHDLETYLAGVGDAAPVKTLQEIVDSRRFHPSVELRLERALQAAPPDSNPGCAAGASFRAGLRKAVLAAMRRDRLDALIYPTWSNVPRLIGDLNTPAGDNNQLFSPSTGFPAVTVPMGYTRTGTLPAGLQFLARPWAEDTLLRFAYAYEQATRHRKPPF